MKLVFLDLDSTLIDSDYKTTIPEKKFSSIVKELEKENVCIGLCSDSAVITLRQWSECLKLTGPIVAERGGVIWSNNIVESTRPLETKWLGFLKESFIQKVSSDVSVVVGDATKFVKKEMTEENLKKQVFVVNGFRTASFSFFACCLKKGFLVPDKDLLKQGSLVTSQIVNLFGKKKLFWDENPKYGILIVHDSETEKKNGISVLVERLKPEKAFMIGNSMSDFIGLPGVLQYAVSNADSGYKEKSDFVSDHSLTEGVVECLQKIIKA